MNKKWPFIDWDIEKWLKKGQKLEIKYCERC